MLKDTQQKQIFSFYIFTIIACFVLAFSISTPSEVMIGMKNIIISRDALITDYFSIAGFGASFFNCGILMIIALVLTIAVKLPFTGITMGVFFISGGFALFGKNPINVLPILLGGFLYAKVNGVKFARYLYTVLFATALSPLITELVYILPFSFTGNLIVAIMVGVLVGYVIPPLAAHTVSMHMGYNLFNVGFATGILAFIIVCILRAYGMDIAPVMIWQSGRPLWLVLSLYGYFIITFVYGMIISKGDFKSALRIMRHPGRAVADFILMDGVGATLINMSIVGTFTLSYILLIKGDLAGPVVGAILTIFGFSAFGIHIKNYSPVLLGIYLSTFLNTLDPTMPSVQIAAIFSACVAPIAGQFGVIAGLVAGYLHICVVSYAGQMYSGLNLYNNGFAGGFVAIIMIPLLESFMKRFKQK